MDLASLQRDLLGLIRSTYRADDRDEPYIRRVAQSADLAEAKGNVFMWRLYVLERASPLTFHLLKQRNRMEETVNAFIASCNIQPFRETQAPAFLESLRGDRDGLVAAVACFELALLKVRTGDTGTYTMDWPFEPLRILHALAKRLPLDPESKPGTYRIDVSRDLPGGFQILVAQSADANS